MRCMQVLRNTQEAAAGLEHVAQHAMAHIVHESCGSCLFEAKQCAIASAQELCTVESVHVGMTQHCLVPGTNTASFWEHE